MPPEAMHVRRAAIFDAAQLAQLSALLGYPISDAQAHSRLSQLLESPTHVVFVADSGSGLAGWASAELRISLESGMRVEITGLVVDAATRRQGLGRLLTGHIERWARAQNCPVLFVRSNVARSESHPFYERLGYVRIKTQHSYSKDLAYISEPPVREGKS
jgi:GNAT superfamily N-acetyltransferase